MSLSPLSIFYLVLLQFISPSTFFICLFGCNPPLLPLSLSLSTLLVFKILWFISLQTLMSSRGKIRARITSKHQHHLSSSSRSRLPFSLPPLSDFISSLLVIFSAVSFSLSFPQFFVPDMLSSSPLSCGVQCFFYDIPLIIFIFYIFFFLYFPFCLLTESRTISMLTAKYFISTTQDIKCPALLFSQLSFQLTTF